MPEQEKEKPSLIERVAGGFAEQAIGKVFEGVSRSVERFVKRIIRAIVLVLAGLVISVLGIAFLAMGAVKWLSLFNPAWLSWAIVGIILLLLGAVLTLAAMLASKR